MYHLGWVGNIIFMLSLAAIVLLAIAQSGNLRDSLKPSKDLIRKISIGILMVSAIYWFVTVPFVSSYEPDYPFEKMEVPVATELTDPSKYLKDHEYRIEYLERRLKREREEFVELHGHYKAIVQLMFFATMYFGGMAIARRRRKPEDEVVKLDLNEK